MMPAATMSDSKTGRIGQFYTSPVPYMDIKTCLAVNWVVYQYQCLVKLLRGV